MTGWLLCCPGTFLWHCYRQPTSKGNSLVCHIILLLSSSAIASVWCCSVDIEKWQRQTYLPFLNVASCPRHSRSHAIRCLPLRWWLNPAKMLWLYVWIRFNGKANSNRLIQQNLYIYSPSSTHDAHSNLTAHLPKYLKPLHIQQVQCDGNWKLCEQSTSVI